MPASRKAHVEVQGRVQLARTMRAAGLNLGDLTQANRDAAAVVAPASAARTPRRTGRLAGSVRAAGTRTAALVRVGSKAVPYAGPILFGWPGHNIAAQSGPVDALAATEPQWLPVYTRAIDAILDKIKGI